MITRIAVLALCLCTTGCGVGLQDVPLAPPGTDSGYTVRATFASALNLPDRAAVRLLGAEVGEVRQMEVRDYTAVVTLRIDEGVRLPAGTRAELRTATPLGDVFVALTPPADVTPAVLRDGDEIPLAATRAAATVEELLTTAALLVNGGAIRNLTDVVDGLGSSVGTRGERLDALLDQSTTLVRTLSARSGEIQAALAETARLTGELSARQPDIDAFLTAAGPAAQTADTAAPRALALIRVLDQLSGELSRMPGIRGDSVGLVANLGRLAAELNNAATSPDGSLVTLNALIPTLLKLTSGTSAHGNIDLEDFAVGALADPAHEADPGSRIPDGGDLSTIVGSLTYTLLKLQDRLNGAGR
ncbi:MlaD family protein [Nocardia sp. NPDC050697]|uniref:MlaD family protein n=1 Tax=Nocardia sp. NPDC050697 TaxID=3155158 RepID=UPI0033C1F11B